MSCKVTPPFITMTGDPPIPVSYYYADRNGNVFELVHVRRSDSAPLAFVTGTCVKSGKTHNIAIKYLRASPEEARKVQHY